MLHVINKTRAPEPAHPNLKFWLQRHAGQIVQSWDTMRAERLKSLRNLSCHPGGEISEQDALELYELSVWFVSRLAAD
jgi:hypothetical protein